MSAQTRFERDRPFAAQVYRLAEAVPDVDPAVAEPVAQFAIAYALLDLSDAVRAHAPSKETP